MLPPIRPRKNLRKKAKARLGAAPSLDPSARLVIDPIAARRRGNRGHPDQDCVLPCDEPGRNALGEAVDRSLVLEGPAKRRLVEEVNYSRQDAAGKAETRSSR